MSKGSNINDNKILKEIEMARDIISELIPSTEDTVIDLPNLKPVVVFQKNTGEVINDQDSLDDFNFARNAMHNLIENGQTALAELLRVAMLSDHPRAFEVVATLMKNIAEMTKDMLGLQEKMLDMQKKKVDLNPGARDPEDMTIEGGFNGTTEELLEQIENKKKKETNDIS